MRAKSEYICKTLSACPGVESVTGRGFMLGIMPKNKKAADVVKECLAKGVVCLTAKDKVRLLPALNIPMELVEKAVAVLAEVLA